MAIVSNTPKISSISKYLFNDKVVYSFLLHVKGIVSSNTIEYQNGITKSMIVTNSEGDISDNLYDWYPDYNESDLKNATNIIGTVIDCTGQPKRKYKHKHEKSQWPFMD